MTLPTPCDTSVEDEAHHLSIMVEEGLNLFGLPEPVGTLRHHRAAFVAAAERLADAYAARTAPAWDTSPEAMSPLVLLVE